MNAPNFSGPPKIIDGAVSGPSWWATFSSAVTRDEVWLYRDASSLSRGLMKIFVTPLLVGVSKDRERDEDEQPEDEDDEAHELRLRHEDLRARRRRADRVGEPAPADHAL